MVEMKRKHPKQGKWEQWEFFVSESSVRPYLPPTQVLTKSSLRLFLSEHPSVYVKPDDGNQGRDVIKVWKRKENDYAFICEKGKAEHCKTIDKLYKKLKTKRAQIVQAAINLAKINGRPFDVRVLMIRDGTGQWQYIGMLAKVAGSGWIITNKRSNGKVLTVDEALKKSLQWDNQQIQTIQQEMIELGYDICKRFDDYKLSSKIGIDMGVDAEGKLWMIEANTGPGWTLFAKLEDRSMYNHIKEILREHREKREASPESRQNE